MKKQRITALCLALLIFFTGLAGCAGGKAKDTAAFAPALTDDKTPDTAAPDPARPARRPAGRPPAAVRRLPRRLTAARQSRRPRRRTLASPVRFPSPARRLMTPAIPVMEQS